MADAGELHTPPGMQVCPTRTDGLVALMASTITVAECQKRQREHYHKCPTCTHYNARNLAAPPALVRPAKDGGLPS